MAFRNHEDFNWPLLIVAAGLGLTIIVTGIILFPSRLGYYAWRRRRQARAANASWSWRKAMMDGMMGGMGLFSILAILALLLAIAALVKYLRSGGK